LWLRRNAASCGAQNFAIPGVPCPRVSALAGIRYSRPFFTRCIARCVTPVFAGLRSSSAPLIASTAAWIRSSFADGS
jgi:hypothetical protein